MTTGRLGDQGMGMGMVMGEAHFYVTVIGIFLSDACMHAYVEKVSSSGSLMCMGSGRSFQANMGEECVVLQKWEL